MELKCHKCEKSDEEIRLHKCPICFKHYCEEHSAHRSGVQFCSKGCGEYFFFAEPDD